MAKSHCHYTPNSKLLGESPEINRENLVTNFYHERLDIKQSLCNMFRSSRRRRPWWLLHANFITNSTKIATNSHPIGLANNIGPICNPAMGSRTYIKRPAKHNGFANPFHFMPNHSSSFPSRRSSLGTIINKKS